MTRWAAPCCPATEPAPAELHFRRAIELAGGSEPTILANLAWTLNRQGKLAGASALYEQVDAAGACTVQILLNWAETENAAPPFRPSLRPAGPGGAGAASERKRPAGPRRVAGA